MKKSLLVLLLTAVFVIVGCANQNGSVDQSGYSAEQIDALAQCLTDNGVTMYGTERCPHCQNQKKRFGDAFENVIYIDCDESRIQCQAAGVEGFPTWITANGQSYAGDQPLSSLAQIGSCDI